MAWEEEEAKELNRVDLLFIKKMISSPPSESLKLLLAEESGPFLLDQKSLPHTGAAVGREAGESEI